MLTSTKYHGTLLVNLNKDIMQKNLCLLTIILTITLLSCRKTSNVETSIVGNWSVDSIQQGSNLILSPSFNTIYRRSSGFAYFWDFRQDGNIYITFGTSYDTIQNYSVVKSASGEIYLKSQPFLTYINAQLYQTDTILGLSSSKLILTSHTGGESIFYFTR